MNCDAVRERLDLEFDLGEALPDAAQTHLRACPDCASYQRALAALDGQLRAAPSVMQDPALVARIQASIAAQPSGHAAPWNLYLGVAAAIAVILAAGWYVDASRITAAALAVQWPSAEWELPGWTAARDGVASAPAAAVDKAGMLVQMLSRYWDQGAERLMALFSMNGVWLWMLFAVCLAGAGTLNASEALARNTRRLRR